MSPILWELFLHHFSFGSWVHSYYPNYYFPSFDSPYITSPKEVDGDKLVYTINVPSHQSKPAALTRYTKGKLADLSTIEFSAMDAWFEEDEEIFIHPKDPYKVKWIIKNL